MLLKKAIIRATLFELWLFLTAQEQRLLSKIAQNKAVEEHDALQNLLKFDLIRKPQQSISLAFTIPLFAEFVKTIGPSVTRQKIFYNPNTKEITKGENVISDLLSPQEYRLLKFLIGNAGRILERDEIIRAVWPDVKVLEGISDEAIDQMVYRTRRKIEDEPATPKHITTVKGQGTRFQP